LIYNGLSAVVSNYSGHEFKTQRDVIKERNTTGDGSGSGLINAVYENYPNLKAEGIHQSIMGKDSISDIETRIRETIQKHNVTVQRYNSMLHKFPTSIIGHYHNLNELDYFSFDNVTYDNIDVFEVKA